MPAGNLDVRDAAVIGCPDDRWGEAVMACVVAQDKSTASEEELIAWLDGRIAGSKKPRRIIFTEELPKGSTNKMRKRELRARSGGVAIAASINATRQEISYV